MLGVLIHLCFQFSLFLEVGHLRCLKHIGTSTLPRLWTFPPTRVNRPRVVVATRRSSHLLEALGLNNRRSLPYRTGLSEESDEVICMFR